MNYCGNCGKMNGDVEGKAPLSFFEKNFPQSVCSCSSGELQSLQDAHYYDLEYQGNLARAIRLASAKSPGGIADYEKYVELADESLGCFKKAMKEAGGSNGST